jgi:hypothetical protein
MAMAMNSMGPNCPMSTELSATDCPQNCCAPALTQVVAALATPEKLRFTTPAPTAGLPVATLVAEPGFATHAPIEPQFVPPPRYILIQNFRV